MATPTPAIILFPSAGPIVLLSFAIIGTFIVLTTLVSNRSEKVREKRD